MTPQITIRAPQAVLTAWLTALRTKRLPDGTEIMQAHHVLHDGKNGYCCLGVLQKVVSNTIEAEPGQHVPSREWLRANNIKFDVDMLVFNSSNPDLPSIHHSAASANDHGYSFEQIADAIEQHAEAV